ncbi:SNF2 helicase associated domain-containing protein [Blautia sp. BX19]|nr:SNF2 helicase associated domain-containing protein [Blautia tarda]
MRYEVPTITVPFLYYPLCNPPPRITINHRISKTKKCRKSIKTRTKTCKNRRKRRKEKNVTFKEQIKKLANSKAYSRGLEIYNKGKILRFQAEENNREEMVLEALVKGSGQNRYSVYLIWDTVRDEMVEADCECPAFREYEGICKHCVAVLLQYYSDSRVKAYREKLEQEKREKLLQIPGVKKGAERKTTEGIRQLLKKSAVVKSLPLIQGDICGKVRLEPHLIVENPSAALHFKIGVDRMYVMKDVFAFARAVERQEEYAYGKNLSFTHAMESFAPESRPLVSFILRWAQKNQYRYGYSGYSPYHHGFTSARNKLLDLTWEGLEEFLELFVGKELPADIFYTSESNWQISDQEPERHLKIFGNPDGIEVSINRLNSVEGRRKNICFLNRRILLEDRGKLKPVQDFLECVEEIPERTIFVAKKDVPLFCAELLPRLEQCFICEKENFDEQDYGVAPPEFAVYLDAPQTDMITCNPKVTYGKKTYSLYDTTDLALRDLGKEAAVREVIQRYGEAYDERQKAMVITDEDKIYDLLTEGIPVFQQLGEVYISDTLKGMQVHPSPKVAVGVSIESGLMQLKMTAGEMSKEELIDILSRYNKRKKYYRLKDGSFVQKEDSGLDILADLKETLQLTDQQLMQESVPVDTYRAMYIDQQLRDNPVISSVRDKNFRSLIRNMKTVEDNDFEIPTELEPILRGYQKTGFLWLKTLSANGFGGILADDMGLGKTLQVICYLLSEYQEREIQEKSKKEPVEKEQDIENEGRQREKKSSDDRLRRNALIVAPASLVYNWNSELERFAPRLAVRMIVGTAAQRRTLLEAADEGEILITSYDLLRRDIDFYKKYRFRCQIIDEAQYIKNHSTQAAKAVKKIKADTRFALTGTPVENRLSELWSIFDYLMPGFLYSYSRFREELEVQIVQHESEEASERLRKMIRPFVLRRLKKDVLRDLPDKLEENMYTRLEGEQQKLYDAHVKRMKLLLDKQSEEEFNTSKIVILSELTKLRQICCDPALLFEEYKGESAKLEMCVDLIRNAVENGHKILVFSQFTTMLSRLADRLENEETAYYMLTGSTGKEKRAKLVEEFNKEDNPTAVFLISLKAGGTGLNLTAADIVIHYDPWWNLAVQNQATDRAHRIGQKNVVNVYKLIAKDTIEENIVKLQEKKHALADQILSGEDMGSGSFSREEILELLGGK